MRAKTGPATRASLGAALLFALVGTDVHAQGHDRDPPAIAHEEVRSARVGEPVAIAATIIDPSGVFDPTVLYRVGDSGEFLRLPMARVAGEGEGWDEGRFEAVIPGEVVSGDLQYFIEAFDELGNGPARYADADLPVRVRVLQTAAPAPTPGLAPAPAEDDGGGLWLVAGAVGGALLLAAAAGVTVGAVLLLSPPPAPSQVDVVINGPTPIARGLSP